MAADAGGAGEAGDGRFHSMEPYLEPGPFGRMLPILYRSQRLRSALLEMSPESAYRRTLMLHFFAWCYRRVNERVGIPYDVFAPNFVLHQSGAIIDTAGTFTGRRALDGVLDELHAAFEQVQFHPLLAVQLGPNGLFLVIRFSARGGGSGVEVDRTIVHRYELRDGVAVRLDVEWDVSEALERAGLDDPR